MKKLRWVILMGDGRQKRLYVCLRCGNKFWSRAKKPQCSVCRSKKVMLWEDFQKLSEQEKAELLPGLFSVSKESEHEGSEGDKVEVEEVKAGDEGKSPVGSLSSRGDGENEAEGQTPKPERVKKEERVKGEKVNFKDFLEDAKKDAKTVVEDKGRRGFSLPGSFKFWVLIGSALGIYIMYKLGMFEEIFEALGLRKKKEEKTEKMPVVRSPVLGTIEQNLRG